jgi:cytochrome c553
MANPIQIILSTVALSTVITTTCWAQTTKAPVPVTPLSLRLKEAEADPKLAENLHRIGRKVAAVCANCHGEGGNSVKPDIPNLAGQNPVYLLEQMRKFSDGTRRFEFMEGMIKAMSIDEKVGITLFYSAQKVIPQPVTDVALTNKGKSYFNKICFRCHGDNGLGNEQFARLAGQQTAYLKTTIMRYRNGDGIRNDPLMAANTKTMTDSDIDAVVAYVSSLP